MTQLLFLVVALLCASAGAQDNSQRDYYVPGKDPADVTGEDFKSSAFNGFHIGALKAKLDIVDKATPGGFGVPVNQDNFPILNYAGLSTGLLVYNEGGQNSFHSHPRGHELVTVLSGGPLACSIVDTKGKLFTFNLALGETGFFPQGLIHLQQNAANTHTIAIQAFSSSNPGTQRIIPATFAGDSADVSVGFNNFLSKSQVETIAANLVKGFPRQA